MRPGLVDTPLLLDGLDPDLLGRLVEQVPAGRLASPEEVAPAFVFLASDHSTYITGATLKRERRVPHVLKGGDLSDQGVDIVLRDWIEST